MEHREINKFLNGIIILLGGLAPVEVSDPAVLANGAKDYTVKTEMSFVNGLVSFLTSGIYAPTTTTIYK